MSDDDEDLVVLTQVPVPDYEPETPEERRRVFALAVVVDRTEPMRLAPDDFLSMCARVNDWLKDGVAQSKPALSTIKGGK